MLKTLRNITLCAPTNAKCGEIFCQSASNFTILCSLCEIKIFEFDDFLNHVKNVHFEKELLKTENIDVKCTQFLEVSADGRDPTYTQVDVQKFSPQSYPQSELVPNTEESFLDDYCHESSDEDEDWILKKRAPATTAKCATVDAHKCELCQRTFRNAAGLTFHHRREHEQVSFGILQCEECQHTFENTLLLDKHTFQAHAYYQCRYCDKTFKSRSGRSGHEPKHGPEKKFVCDVENCGKDFYTKRRLLVHRQLQHMPSKKFICEVCGYSCKQKMALIIHVRSHTGEKPFSCKTCGNKFSSQAMLSEHQASHATSRPYECEVCGATFNRPKALYHHKHLHLGVKKFVCKICGNAYAQAAGLAGHRRKHTECA